MAEVARARAVQQHVCDIVHRDEASLNDVGDTATIVDALFAADGVAQWNVLSGKARKIT